MAYHKQSPCARCAEAYEEEGANILLIRCGAVEDGPSLIETQRLKHPRGAVHMCTEGPLPGCPRQAEFEKRRRRDAERDRLYAAGCARARAMLERSLYAAADRG